MVPHMWQKVSPVQILAAADGSVRARGSGARAWVTLWMRMTILAAPYAAA